VVKLYTDSNNASVIASKGSTSLRLQRKALEIFQFCAVNNVSMEIEWIPRSLNEYADSLSRVVDFDDWSVSAGFFACISSLFGPFTVDRFASPDSAKCARFYSKFWCPGAEGVDASSVDWAGENNWMVPPIYLISRTVFHLEERSARRVLVTPKWLSAPFWPTVFPMGGHRPSVLQFKWLSSLNPPLFLHPFVMAITRYFVRLDLSRFSFIVGWFCSCLLNFCFLFFSYLFIFGPFHSCFIARQYFCQRFVAFSCFSCSS